MEIKLKNINLSRDNRQDATGFGNTIDFYIERLNKLQKLYDNNCSDREYCENIFSMYEVRFDDDYMDIVDYISAKKGTIFTNIPYLYNGVWTFLSYDIAYYELDLEHTYIKEEIDMLLNKYKIMLLSSRPYMPIPYQDNFENVTRLSTIEDYDFSNMSNNSRLNNRIVIDMINEIFNKYKLKESIDSERQRLIEMLESYRNHSLQMISYHNGNVGGYKELIHVCEDKIKKISKKVSK